MTWCSPFCRAKEFMVTKWCFSNERKERVVHCSHSTGSQSHSHSVSPRITRISPMKPSTRLLPWFLCGLVSQALGHNMHSFRISIIKGQLFQCANTTCSPSITLAVSSVRSCQIACLNDDSCRAASFQRSTSICELFAYAPNQNESMTTNVEMVTMFVISGTRVPSGEYDIESVLNDRVHEQCYLRQTRYLTSVNFSFTPTAEDVSSVRYISKWGVHSRWEVYLSPLSEHENCNWYALAHEHPSVFCTGIYNVSNGPIIVISNELMSVGSSFVAKAWTENIIVFLELNLTQVYA